MRKTIWKIVAGSIIVTLLGLGTYLVGQLDHNKEDSGSKSSTQKTSSTKFKPYTGEDKPNETNTKSNKKSAKKKSKPKKKQKTSGAETEVTVLENTVAREHMNAEEFRNKKSKLRKKAEKMAKERKEIENPTREKSFERTKKAAEVTNQPINFLNHVSLDELKNMMPNNLNEHPLGGRSLDVNPNNMKEGRKEARPLPPPKNFKKLAEPVPTDESGSNEGIKVRSGSASPNR